MIRKKPRFSPRSGFPSSIACGVLFHPERKSQSERRCPSGSSRLMRDLDSKIRALQQLELDSPGFNQSTKTLESIKATRSAMSIGDYSTPLHGLRAILIGSVYGIDFSLGIVSLIRGFTAIAARFGSGDFSVRIDPRRKNDLASWQDTSIAWPLRSEC
jgi:hypothetical protein